MNSDMLESDRFKNLLEQVEISSLNFEKIIIADLDKCSTCFQIQKSKVRDLIKNQPESFVIILSNSEKKGKILLDGIRPNFYHDKQGIFKSYFKGSHSVLLFSKNQHGEYESVGVI
ncbi:hypothetical protein M3O96_05415 [Aquiflexum sp. TKW24L]|uniref:hypothetical protein n=1 Tax=Aquiflexum sp. TKW24L TaxID=2942212 RepID=UPI0020C070CC|nr:hypothetical protein [Aquiflexum sp. TKW24L]MCL6258516.1 hypothetical protein [Aquiflexum sp. TKW24L]